jgi:hypothetical protein
VWKSPLCVLLCIAAQHSAIHTLLQACLLSGSSVVPLGLTDHSFEDHLTRDEAGPMRYFIAACLLCASLLTRIPPLASTSPFWSFVVAWKSPLYVQRCIAAPHNRSEVRPVFQGEENIPDDKVRSDLTEVAKLVYEHTKLELRHKRSKYVWRPWRPWRPQPSHQLLFGQRPWFRHWLPIWEPGFPLRGSSLFRGAAAETCLQSYWLVEWALGVQYMALGVHGFWVVEPGSHDWSGDFDWTAGR